MNKPNLKAVAETEANSLTEAISTPTAPDPFDAKALALPPDFFVAGGPLNPKPKNVQVRKPHNQEWIRVHPDPDYRCNYGAIFLRDDREFYLLAPAITKSMRGHRHLKTVTIYTTWSRLSGKTFLWPVGIVGQLGQNKRTENWYRTAHEAAEEAVRQLVNVWADLEGGGYEWQPSENPEANTPPEWPELTFTELLQIAFQRTGCFVDSFDHDVFKKLKAELKVDVDLSCFTTIVAADFEFEFGGRDGNLPRPVCMVAKELRSGKIWRLWRDELGPEPPFPIGADALFVSFTASAELGCFKVLSWPMPARILDLSAEYRNFRNLDYPRSTPKEFREKKGLIDACCFFGIDTTGAGEKKAMRRRILEGEPYSEEEIGAILEYCAGDVFPLEKLLVAMAPHIDLPRALLRGRHEATVAAMEHAGIPIDMPMLTAFREHWTGIQDDLIAKLDANFGVYEGRSFRRERFVELIARLGIRNWPQLESGQLDLEDKTFKDMAKAYPVLAPLRELRHSLSSLRLDALAVGEDGRNRTKLWPYSTKTGRNLPAPDEFIFGPSRWLRGLIKPEPGFGVAYIDWKTQEVGIGAARSGDENMMADYLSADLYTAFGIAAGVLPKGATKKTHNSLREMLKQCVLGLQYGMGSKTLAFKIGRSELMARSLIEAHYRRYKKFWRWSNAIVGSGMQGFPLSTVFGWRLHPTEYSRPTTLMSFPMQANGAEILRLACCLGVERGIRICAPIHDAILIEAPLERLEADVAAMRDAMAEASRTVLDGFELVTECPDGGDFPQSVRYPQRYMDERGSEMWNTVTELVTERQAMPRARVRAKGVDDLLYWIEERERVRMRKEAGVPEPYTDDEILRTGRFCNVRREDDRTTRWIAERWRTPHANDPDLFIAMTIARLVNKAETLDALGYPLPWDPERFLSVMAKCDTPYGAAYTITAKKGYPSKPAFQAKEIFGRLWEARAFVRPRPGDTLERFSARLSDFKYLGTFYRGQIIADLKYVEPLRSAPDWATFAEPGPGSKPGLNLVLDRPVNAPWTDNEWRGELRWLRDEIAPDLERLGLGDLHRQDLQNCCCEIFKFLRARSGERSVRRRYRKAA